MNMDLYKVTGVSRFKGVVKVRFANDMTRIKMLVKAGNEDIELFELAEAQDKAGCCRALLSSELYTRNVEFAEAIDEANEKYNPTVKVAQSTLVKNPKRKVPVVKPTLAGIAARGKTAVNTVIDVMQAAPF
jgi:hypothetical protein